MTALVTDLYLPTDLEEANQGWGANCGPGALSALLGVPLAKVRELLGPDWPGWTNIKHMKAALDRAGRTYQAVRPPKGSYPRELDWAGGPQGVAFIQLEGPWEAHWFGAYRHTHWIAWRVAGGKTRVYDVNDYTEELWTSTLQGGWRPLRYWADLVLFEVVKADGATGWHWRSALVVE